MKVSIITVCLNSAATIEQTIQSVLGQTWKNIEYIIVDGQSTDGTLGIVDKYRDKIAKCISEKDQGLYDAMNKGISMTTGEIIGILNSDDWYAKDAVEKVVNAFQEENADLVYGAMEIVHPSGYTSRVKNDALEHMLYRCVIPHPTVFVRRRAYQEVGMFDLEYKVLADYDLLMRMYLHHVKISQIPAVLTYFRKGGFSTEHAIQCTEEMRSIARHYARQRQDVKTLEKIDEYYQKRIKRAQAQDMAQELVSKHKSETAAMLQECLNGNKKIKIFGAGSVGTECFYFLKEMGMEVECFLDNDESKCHEQFLGKAVQSCSNREESDEEQYIVIAVVSYQEEIVKQLENIGYRKDKDYCLYYELVESMFLRIREVTEVENIGG
ncbi:MAG: glycosyltransferase [Lachnospiraceae bacterium]|nr:glycosyltransferase [Lachnospiraceae bacterium]